MGCKSQSATGTSVVQAVPVGVRTTTVLSEQAQFVLGVSDDVGVPNASLVAAATVERPQRELRMALDACDLHAATMLVRGSSADYAMVTRDLFGNVQHVDVGAMLCASLPAACGARVTDVASTVNMSFVATNKGLFARRKTSQTFAPVVTGVAVIDGGGWAVAAADLRLIYPPSCDAAGDVLHAVFRNSSGATVIVRSTDALHASWSAVTLPTALALSRLWPALADPWAATAAVNTSTVSLRGAYTRADGTSVYLVEVGPANVHLRTVVQDAAGAWQAGFIFPASMQVQPDVLALAGFDDDLGLLAFGSQVRKDPQSCARAHRSLLLTMRLRLRSQLYFSSDSGVSFSLLSSLPAGHSARYAATSPVQMSIAVATSGGLVFFSRSLKGPALAVTEASLLDDNSGAPLPGLPAFSEDGPLWLVRSALGAPATARLVNVEAVLALDVPFIVADDSSGISLVSAISKYDVLRSVAASNTSTTSFGTAAEGTFALFAAGTGVSLAEAHAGSQVVVDPYGAASRVGRIANVQLLTAPVAAFGNLAALASVERANETDPWWPQEAACTTCPAVVYALTLAFASWQGADRSVVLSLAVGAGGEGWLATDVGKTVRLRAAAVLITARVNASHAQGLLFSAPANSAASLTVSAPSGQWLLLDMRRTQDRADVGLQTLTLTRQSGATFTATLTAGTMKFGRSMLGSVLSNAGSTAWGIVDAIVSDLQATVVCVTQFASPTTLTAGQWRLFRAAPGSSWSALPSPAAARSQWAVAPSDCPYSWMSDRREFGARSDMTRFLDALDRTTIASLLLADSAGKLQGLEVAFVTRASFHVDARVSTSWSSMEAAVNWTGAYPLEPATQQRLGSATANDFVLTVDMGQDPLDRPGEVNVHVSPTDTTLRCRTSMAVYKVKFGCPPGKRLEFRSLVTEADLGMSAFRDPAAFGLFFEDSREYFEWLPVNYRPPSGYGKDVPVTENIYNADPSRPRPSNFFPISQSTGTFKRCANHSGGTGAGGPCQCTDDMRASWRVADSDCMDRAIRWSYHLPFAPKFNLLADDRPTVRGEDVLESLVLTEVNQRTDFCLNGSTCTSSSGTVTIHPQAYEGLSFYGEGLYHFRAVVPSLSHCTLTTDFAVFVVDAPLRNVVITMIKACTALLVAAVLFVIYLLHERVQKTGP